VVKEINCEIFNYKVKNLFKNFFNISFWKDIINQCKSEVKILFEEESGYIFIPNKSKFLYIQIRK